MRTSKPLICSFCGKSDVEVEKLVAGPKVFICDECTFLTVDILAQDKAWFAQKAAARSWWPEAKG